MNGGDKMNRDDFPMLKKDYIYFDCRYNYSNLKDNKIKILSWNKQEITFKYGDKTETFKAK